jgi:hypothetical protein
VRFYLFSLSLSLCRLLTNNLGRDWLNLSSRGFSAEKYYLDSLSRFRCKSLTRFLFVRSRRRASRSSRSLLAPADARQVGEDDLTCGTLPA